MKIRASVTDVSRRFADHVNRVAYRDEEFVLVRGGKPVAELRPVPRGGRLGDLPELLASIARLASGDGDSFARDLDDIRAAANRTEGICDPWA
jgi:antitoxin (DNA-binding transcriptional repressor) of toxin-antitoxin stability system